MAETNNKKTIYQNLNTFLNLDGAGLTSADFKVNPEEKILLKAERPEDLRVKALELQQKEVIFDKFFKIQQSGFQKAMQYEAARLPAYIDYEGMEYYPLIASALDLLMEESTTIGDDGKMLRIYSKKERIKEILEEFFYGTLNINVNLPFWTRNLVKYGDNFVYLLGEKGKGIRYARQLVNYDIERKDEFKDKKVRTIFRNRVTGDEFNLFEIAHFRLLGDDKFLPYGSSILNKVRRVFRQLIMAEDAMLTYRILRAGEKRVFKVDVGNLDDKDIEAYVMKVATKFKKQQQVYKNNGQIDYRFNILGNDEDIFMPVRDGKSTVIETLPGATNLNEIQDITYLRDNLFSGLGIPKPFLGFQGSAGEGKNLAQMDVRFAKKVNRIQQALIQELNKMAIIHLYLKGFEDDLHEFTLSLTNPSTQADKLKTESLQAKVQLYNDLTRTESSGIAATSHTWAKRNLFNWSDKEIMEDLKNQRMERAISLELQNSGIVIPKTGVFDSVDKKYGTTNPLPMAPPGTPAGGAPAEPGEGVNGGNPPPDVGATNAPQSIDQLPEPQGQGGAPMQEGRKKLNEDTFEDKLQMLVGMKNKPKASESEDEIGDSLSGRAKKLNNNAKQMINEIDKMMFEGNGKFNTTQEKPKSSKKK
jgi:hypothetical protein